MAETQHAASLPNSQSLIQAALRLEEDPLLFFEGTFFPLRRASDKPIAIACLRLFTVFPLRPDFSFPRLNSCISRFTSLPALGLYLRREDFLPRDLLLLLRELELRLRLFVGMNRIPPLKISPGVRFAGLQRRLAQ